jgi:hypothetical protein
MNATRFAARLTAPLAVTAVTGLAALVVVAPTAAAHDHGSDSAPYDSRILSVVPPVAGLSVTTSDAGEYLNLANTGPTTVIVEGYQREPYLKITNGGVWENQRSESTYLNKSLFGDSLTQNKNLGDPNEPDWKQIASTGATKYHDHRIHWMGTDRPPMVQNDPGHDHLIASWRVHLRADDTPVTIHGELRWLAIQPANYGSAVGPILAVVALCITAILITRVRINRAARAHASMADQGVNADNASSRQHPSAATALLDAGSEGEAAD